MAEDKESLEKKALEKAYDAMKESCIALICKELNCKPASPTNFELFHMFESLDATTVGSFKSTNLNYDLRVALAEYYSEAPTAKSSNGGTDLYFFGHLVVKTNYPKTYIHKETIKDKIEDIFLKQDVDFLNSKKFSKKFQVLSVDREGLQDLLQFKTLDDLANFPEMEIELLGNRLLFRNSRKAISMEEAAGFCKLAKTILAVFN